MKTYTTTARCARTFLWVFFFRIVIKLAKHKWSKLLWAMYNDDGNFTLCRFVVVYCDIIGKISDVCPSVIMLYKCRGMTQSSAESSRALWAHQDALIYRQSKYVRNNVRLREQRTPLHSPPLPTPILTFRQHV